MIGLLLAPLLDWLDRRFFRPRMPPGTRMQFCEPEPPKGWILIERTGANCILAEKE